MPLAAAWAFSVRWWALGVRRRAFGRMGQMRLIGPIGQMGLMSVGRPVESGVGSGVIAFVLVLFVL
jgi:hypothetical protein